MGLFHVNTIRSLLVAAAIGLHCTGQAAGQGPAGVPGRAPGAMPPPAGARLGVPGVPAPDAGANPWAGSNTAANSVRSGKNYAKRAKTNVGRGRRTAASVMNQGVPRTSKQVMQRAKNGNAVGAGGAGR